MNATKYNNISIFLPIIPSVICMKALASSNSPSSFTISFSRLSIFSRWKLISACLSFESMADTSFSFCGKNTAESEFRRFVSLERPLSSLLKTADQVNKHELENLLVSEG